MACGTLAGRTNTPCGQIQDVRVSAFRELVPPARKGNALKEEWRGMLATAVSLQTGRGHRLQGNVAGPRGMHPRVRLSRARHRTRVAVPGRGGRGTWLKYEPYDPGPTVAGVDPGARLLVSRPERVVNAIALLLPDFLTARRGASYAQSLPKASPATEISSSLGKAMAGIVPRAERRADLPRPGRCSVAPNRNGSLS